MKRVISVITIITVMLCLASCRSVLYTSSYRAVGFVHSNTKSNCKARFVKLDGTYVFKLKKSSGNDCDLGYIASLEEGELTVCYDSLGVKEPLISVKAEEELEGRGGYVTGVGTVYVIIEAASAKGSVEVWLNEQNQIERTLKK